MVNLMNVAAPQESAGTGHPVSTASGKPHAPPETQGLFAMLFQALQSLAQPVTGGGPAPLVSDEGQDSATGEAHGDIAVPVMQPPIDVPAPPQVEETSVTQPDSGGQPVVVPVMQPPIDIPAPPQVEETSVTQPDSGGQPVAVAAAPTAEAEAISAAGTVAQTVDPVPTADEPVSGVPEQVSFIPATNGGTHVGLSRMPGTPVSSGVERQSLDAAGGGRGTQPSATRMAGLQKPLAAGQTDGARVLSRDGPAVDVASYAARPAEVASPDTASFQMHSVDEGQQPATDTVRMHLVASVPREAGATPADLRAAAMSAARNVAQRTDGTPNVRSPDLGGQGAGARSAGRDTGSGVQSQPTPLAESVGPAQPEIDESVRDKFTTVERTVAGQTSLAGRAAGRGPVEHVGRSALVGRSAETPAPLVDQVVRVVRVLTNEQRTEMRVRMWPPNLGELNVRLVHENDSLCVQLAAETGAARDLLEARLPQLRHALAEVGGRANDVSVTVTATEQPVLAAFTANHGAGHTPYQQAGRPHGPPQGMTQHAELPDESASDGSGTRSVLTAGHIDVHA